MKATTLILASFVLATLAPAQLAERPSESDFRIWKNTEGVELKARFLKFENEVVHIQREDGGRFQVPIGGFSEEDQTWVKEQVAAAEAAVQATESLAFAPLLAEVNEVIFEDDLSEIRDGWAMGNGEWKTEEGVLIGKELEADNHAATFRRSLPLGDAVIQFSFKLDGARATTFSIDNSTGHLCRLSISATGFTAQKDDNDKDQGPDEGARYHTIERDLADGEWHTAMFEMVGDTVLAQIDGEEREVSIGAHEMFNGEKSKIGFTISGESVHYKDLRVWKAEPKEDWEKTRDRLID